jgi:P4 family phage/plasmid primase-like protien
MRCLAMDMTVEVCSQSECSELALIPNGENGACHRGTSATELVDTAEVRRALKLILMPGQVTELRVFAAGTGRPKLIGYFDQPEMLVESLASVKIGRGFYIILNPINPALLERSPNQTRLPATGQSTKDSDIVSRVWLFIDCDSERPDKKQSATDAEHTAALERGQAIKTFLTSLGWPDPIEADSGNGGHLLYRIDLPTEDEGLVQRILAALSAQFSDSHVKVDTCVHNPARLCKLYGTLAAKGENTEERPHRMSRILKAPEAITVVTREQLVALAGSDSPKSEQQENSDIDKAKDSKDSKKFDIDSFISRNKLQVAGPNPWEDGGRRWTFTVSPLCAHHGDGPFLVQFSNGALAAGCHHDSCSWTWKHLRAKYEPSPAKDADPGVIAAEVIAAQTFAGLSSLRFWNESFWQWKDGRYIEQLNSEVRAEVLNHFVRQWIYVKGEHISNVIEHLRAKTILSSGYIPPTWLAKQPASFGAHDCLATRNRVIHLPSFIDGSEPFFVPATPAFLTVTAAEFDLDLNAPNPEYWHAFLESIWGDDDQSKGTLQEIFGYLLTADTRQQKIFLMIGPPRSGKGTIARVLRGLVGEGNVAGPTLASLAAPFGLSQLVGKSVAIVADARVSARTDQATVVEHLLSISGEDKRTIDRKHQTAIHCQLPTRFLILSNELPRLFDASGTIVSRFVLLQTKNSFLGLEDHDLEKKLISELPGILLWAICGWKRLRERGRFEQPKGSGEAVDQMTCLASPVTGFVRDRCTLEDSARVAVPELFRAWGEWCSTQGQNYTGTVQTFGRDLRAAFSRVRDAGQKREKGGITRYYSGIGLAV